MHKHFFCSVIVPARNEAGNIQATVERIPHLGRGTEVIVVEGGSQDQTWAVLKRLCPQHPELRILKQSGRGKAAAVRDGFAQARGELLLILDADLTVAPEELTRFYSVAYLGRADFVNGVRRILPGDRVAMPLTNRIANRFFSVAFSAILGQPIQDTLCGTKVLFRTDYLAMAQEASLDSVDPFGDFDLLLGAARLKLRVVDLPVLYRGRTYGHSNIHRWRHGCLLLRQLIAGFIDLKELPLPEGHVTKQAR